MNEEFLIRIITPTKTLFETYVSEATLPAFDGEVGILPRHADFIGLLGTGALKIVTNGDDYWFMVTSGVFEVRGGTVTALTDLGQKAEDIDLQSAKARLGELETELANSDTRSEQYQRLSADYEQAMACVEVHRRTNLVN